MVQTKPATILFLAALLASATSACGSKDKTSKRRSASSPDPIEIATAKPQTRTPAKPDAAAGKPANPGEAKKDGDRLAPTEASNENLAEAPTNVVKSAEVDTGFEKPSVDETKEEGTEKELDAPPSLQGEENDGRSVATVNGVPLSARTFEEEVARITKRNSNIPDDRLGRIKSNILERLIERELINQAIKKAGITVSEDDLKKSFEEYKKRFEGEEQFQNYLKHGQVTVAIIQKRLRDKKLLETLIDARGNLNISREEAKAFYEKNLKYYTEQARVKASHILLKLPPKPTSKQEKEVLSRIKAIQKRLKNGEDFAALAKELSEGPSKVKGGDLGYFTAKQMLKPFSDKAFSMKPGQTSSPVKTRFGYHLIRVVDKKPERTKNFDEVQEQISKSLRNKKFFKGRRELLSELKEKATIVKEIP